MAVVWGGVVVGTHIAQRPCRAHQCHAVDAPFERFAGQARGEALIAGEHHGQLVVLGHGFDHSQLAIVELQHQWCTPLPQGFGIEAHEAQRQACLARHVPQDFIQRPGIFHGRQANALGRYIQPVVVGDLQHDFKPRAKVRPMDDSLLRVLLLRGLAQVDGIVHGSISTPCRLRPSRPKAMRRAPVLYRQSTSRRSRSDRVPASSKRDW
ncbi:hypothetical protein D3C81_1155240 [compost metagenome]